MMGGWPDLPPAGDAKDRAQLLAEVSTPEAKARAEAQKAMLGALDNEEIAPSKGLMIRTETFASEPDGNRINFFHPIRR